MKTYFRLLNKMKMTMKNKGESIQKGYVSREYLHVIREKCVAGSVCVGNGEAVKKFDYIR